MKSPRKVDAIPIRIIAGTTSDQLIPDRSVKKAAIIIGTNALTIPKRIAPEVLATISSSKEIGDRSSLSKEQFLLSNVRVTDSSDVVPNSMEIVTTPGKSSGILSIPLPDLIKNIPVHASGKMIPQLILGGLR
jgi:hypothetical protein